MKRGKLMLQPLGQQFGRSDLERVGYFHDPSPAPFDEYEGPVKFREGIEKGRQIQSGPPNALFEEKFVRIFNGEALNEPWRFKGKAELQRKKGKVGPRFLLPSPAKKQSTPGDYYGCFEKISYFSYGYEPEDPKKKVVPERPNMLTRPNPRGGPGYANICLNPFPEYTPEPYDLPKEEEELVRKRKSRFLTASAPLPFFPPHPYKALEVGPTYVRPEETVPRMIRPGRILIPFPKKPGGCHAGGFHKLTYSSSPYTPDKEETRKISIVFVSGGPPLRSKYTTSIIKHVTNISCNSKNYRKYEERVYPLRK